MEPNAHLLTGPAPDPITWTEHPDCRFPGRTVLVGVYFGKTYHASFVGRRDKAVDAIRHTARAEGTIV